MDAWWWVKANNNIKAGKYNENDDADAMRWDDQNRIEEFLFRKYVSNVWL